MRSEATSDVESESAQRHDPADEPLEPDAGAEETEIGVKPGWRTTLVGGLVRAARPKQWVKNLLVFAAPGAAGLLTEGAVLADAALAFVWFSMAASGTYFLNDTLDAEADRHHPIKRLRPIAAGVVPGWLGYASAIGLLGLGLAGAFAFSTVAFGIVLSVYVALTISYSMWLKNIALIDICVVSAGFILRAIGGGAATDVPVSEWFVIVTSAVSLFMVIAKRYGEIHDIEDDPARHRAALAAYSPGYLNHLRTVTSAVAITAYSLWAFETASKSPDGGIWFELSIAPFVLAMFRYAMVCDHGTGSAPEDVVLGDRFIQIVGLVWVGFYGAGLYVS